MESNISINNSNETSLSNNVFQNNNYQYNIFSPYYTQNNFYNNSNNNVANGHQISNTSKGSTTSNDYNGFENNSQYYSQQKINEQQSYNNYQAANYYSNYQAYLNTCQPYEQQHHQLRQDNVCNNEPVRTNTPDKPIMNDSGVGVSPEILLNAVNNDIQIVKSDEENEETNEDSNDESFTENNVPDENINKKYPSKTNNCDSSLMKPPKPYLEIIADAILTAPDHMMQLHEIYNYMETKYAYFAKNVNKSWRNSVRHNLSLNECFVKAGRGSNGKGNYWKIHNACEPDFIRGNFRRKNFKILIRQNCIKQQQSHHQTQSHQPPHTTATTSSTSTASIAKNPFNTLNYFNQQLQSFGIENFLNSNNLVSYNSSSLAQQRAPVNHRFQPY